MNDIDTIQKLVKLVVKDMQERHPNCPHTVRILLWDDGTSLVECRHTRKSEHGTIICNSVYDKEELSYNEHLLDYDKIRIDGRGNEYHIKSEL